jgi:hypothetical protein
LNDGITKLVGENWPEQSDILTLTTENARQGQETVMTTEKIQTGFDVFLHDGEHAFGAVRRVMAREIVVFIENAGDFTVSLNAVQDVHDEKVILNSARIDNALKVAIDRAHKGEDPRI